MTTIRPGDVVARPVIRATGTLVIVALLAGCTSATTRTGSGSSSGPISINAGDRNCDLGRTTLPAGRHTFEVTNTAGQVTEVYVYADGDRIMGEVENIGPSTKRNLIVDLPAGDYQVACKPGMVGQGNRTALKVRGAASPSQTLDQDLAAAVASYRRYVQAEAQALVDTTAPFTAAITAGNLAAAKQAYPNARLHYERIEPIAESFGDLDPLIDMRIDDVTAGTPFVGFHALEQLLYQKNSLAGAAPLAAALSTNVAKLNQLVTTVKFSPLTMGNGAKALLDEVAKSKVTGEEERYSRIDLVDFAGNVDGAKYVYSALRPALITRDAALVKTLDARFAALITLLGSHRGQPGQRGYIPGSPFVSYDVLSAADIKALASEVDAISEPLGRISGAVSSK